VTDCLLHVDSLINKALSEKRHASITSLDFEKSFEKVGLHTIKNQFIKWGCGPRLIKYVTQFMTSRKIRVKVNHSHSLIQPLHNGIPQGSPLSVIPSLIAYNSLSDTISKHKNINFTAFADYYNIIVDLKNICNWCNLSGASLSLSKCKHIHICRKHNCVCQLSTVTNSICTVAELTMLDLSFDRKYKWQPHINKLAKSLTNKSNRSKPFKQCNPFSTRSLLLIDRHQLTPRIEHTTLRH